MNKAPSVFKLVLTHLLLVAATLVVLYPVLWSSRWR